MHAVMITESVLNIAPAAANRPLICTHYCLVEANNNPSTKYHFRVICLHTVPRTCVSILKYLIYYYKLIEL